MLSADDHPGIVYFMIGTILLVLSGIGLSVVMDRKQRSSSGNADVRDEIATHSDEISSLTSRHGERAALLEKRSRLESEQSAAMAGMRERIATLGQRRSALVASRDRLVEELPGLDQEFATYRAAYRRRAWEGAVNERVGTLTIRGGREYYEVEIARVTEVGIEIRHQNGIARIQAPDLDDAWQNRFQWSDEERRSRLQEESEAHRRMAELATSGEAPATRPLEGRPSPIGRYPAPPTSPESDALDDIRAQVIGWKQKVSRISAERSSALSQASYGSGNSVAGSLETWKAKSTRLGAELVQANTQLALAKARLAAVAPNDPLLREPQQDRIDR